MWSILISTTSTVLDTRIIYEIISVTNIATGQLALSYLSDQMHSIWPLNYAPLYGPLCPSHLQLSMKRPCQKTNSRRLQQVSSFVGRLPPWSRRPKQLCRISSG